MTERACFVARVRPERLDEYRDLHHDLPDDLVAAFARSGRRSYSIFIGDDGTVVGCYEADSMAAMRDALRADPAVAAWNVTMAPFFAAPPRTLDAGVTVLP